MNDRERSQIGWSAVGRESAVDGFRPAFSGFWSSDGRRQSEEIVCNDREKHTTIVIVREPVAHIGSAKPIGAVRGLRRRSHSSRRSPFCSGSWAASAAGGRRVCGRRPPTPSRRGRWRDSPATAGRHRKRRPTRRERKSEQRRGSETGHGHAPSTSGSITASNPSKVRARTDGPPSTGVPSASNTRFVTGWRPTAPSRSARGR